MNLTLQLLLESWLCLICSDDNFFNSCEIYLILCFLRFASLLIPFGEKGGGGGAPPTWVVYRSSIDDIYVHASTLSSPLTILDRQSPQSTKVFSSLALLAERKAINCRMMTVSVLFWLVTVIYLDILLLRTTVRQQQQNTQSVIQFI